VSGQVDVARRFLDAFAAGDDQTQIALLHPDVELVEWPEAPDTHHVRGVRETIEIRNSWFEAWDSLRYDVEEFLESGDRVVACGKAQAKGKGSAVEVDFDSYTVFTLRDGRIARMEFFIEKEPALATAGLTQTREAG
jgi:ketosteroid isomerase-like protein